MFRFRKSRREPAVPRVSLSRQGFLRRSILLGVAAMNGVSGSASAAPFGSPTWFAQQQAPGSGMVSPSTGSAAATGISFSAVSTPSQALVHAQRSMDNFNRAAAAIEIGRAHV